MNTQHYSLFQITECLLWRNTPLIKDVFRPASYTVDHSLLCIQAYAILRLRTCGLCDLEISHTWFMQSQDSTHVLCNSEIACAILGFRECATQSRDCTNSQMVWNILSAILIRLNACAFGLGANLCSGFFLDKYMSMTVHMVTSIFLFPMS